MKRLPKLLFCLVFGVIDLYAARISGTIRKDNNPLQSTPIQVACGAHVYSGVSTDQYGSYSINISERGRCIFSVVTEGKSPAAFVFSFDDPIRADFDVVTESNGNFILRRR